MSPLRNAEHLGQTAAPAAQLPPAALLEAVEEVASGGGVAQLDDGQLAASVAAVSTRYTRQRQALGETGTGEAMCARLRFFLPRDFPKVQGPLAELIAAGALQPRPRMRVLDLGSGLGATALGAAELLLREGQCTGLDVTAVDADAAALQLGARVADAYARRRGAALTWRTRTSTLDAWARAPQEQADLVLLGLVLNEAAAGLDDDAAVSAQAELLRTLTQRLAPGGALIVIEPALRSEGRRLLRVRQALLEGSDQVHLFAPCLHRGRCPMLERERDWCHELLPLSLPEPAAAIARAAGLRDADLTYSYLTLTAEPRSLASLGRDHDGDADADASERAYRIVSGPMRSKGKVELLLCDEGPARRLRRLDRNRSEGNARLAELGRGTLVSVRGGQLQGTRLEVTADTEVEVLHGVTMW